MIGLIVDKALEDIDELFGSKGAKWKKLSETERDVEIKRIISKINVSRMVQE